MAQLYRIMPDQLQERHADRSPCAIRRSCQMLDELRNFLGYDVRAVVATETRHQGGARPLLSPRRKRRVSSSTDMERGSGPGQGRGELAGREGPST